MHSVLSPAEPQRPVTGADCVSACLASFQFPSAKEQSGKDPGRSEELWSAIEVKCACDATDRLRRRGEVHLKCPLGQAHLKPNLAGVLPQ